MCVLQVLDLISSDNLNVPSEEEVYRAVLSWVKHDIDGRRQHVPRVSLFLLDINISMHIYNLLLSHPFSCSLLMITLKLCLKRFETFSSS